MSGPPVQNFPPRRACALCATVLSIYNGTVFCSVHEPPGSGFIKPRRLMR